MAMRTRGGDQLSEFYDALQKRIITIDDIASEEEAGIVKADGKSITVDEDGTLHGTGGEIASADKAGIVKPDNKTIEASEDGTLSAKVATGDSVGVVKPDGETITVDGDGTLHGAMKVDIATTEKAGIVKPDGDTITIEDDGTIKGAMKIGIATSETAGIVKPDDDTISVTEDGTIAVKNALKGTVGSETVPIYLNEGELTAVTKVGEASEADHAKTADKATTADSASQAAYLNFKLVGDGVDLNTYRGIEQAGIYLKTAENVTVTNTPAGVLPNEAGILEVMPLNASGATEQRYTSFGEAHEYVRYSNDIGNWDGWTTIGPMSSVSEAAHADIADNAHYANVAKQLGSITVGSGTKPIYLNLGNPTEIDGTVGSEDIPVSLISGELTAVDKVKAAKTSDTATSLTNERKFKVTNGSVSSPEVSFNGTSDVNINLNNLDASTLTAGTVPIARLPQGALERLVTVADEAARFALTTGEVQLGDIVQQLDTKVMYVVVDESKLNESAGYTEFSAGLATKATEADHAKKADNADNATNATTADTATKLGSSTIGDATHGIYLQDGVPTKVEKVASAENADNATNATKAINADNATNATTAGTANKLGSTTIGSATRPIYLDNGTPKPVNIASGSGKTVNTVPVVKSNGIMEIGKYLDFHDAESTKTDYDARLQINNTNARALTLPDETGTLAISRRCLVGQSALTKTNPWYKVATYETSGINIDTHISFYVYRTMDNDVNGILNIRLRTNGSNNGFQTSGITWSNAVNIDPNDFVLAYTPSNTTPCKAELWAKMSSAWKACVFTVIQESSRTAVGSVASKWKLINKFSAGDQAEITPGYTQKVSTISTIKNTADTATTISEVLPVEKGGTGKITAKEAAISLLLNLDKSADQSIVEDKYFVYSNGDTVSNLKKMSAIWDWLKPKVQSTPSTPINAANLNLDTLTYENYNGRIAYAGEGNTAQGKPEGVDSFGMLIFRSASGYTSQLMITTHTEVYFRNIGGGQAGEWKKIYPVTATEAETLKTTLPIAKGGTGQTNRKDAFYGLAFLGYNPIASTEEDTAEKWRGMGTGYAFFSQNDKLNGQPSQYGFVLNIVHSSEVRHIWLTQAQGKMYQRGGNSSTTVMPAWTEIYTTYSTLPKVNNATTADKLGTSSVGNSTKPIYLSDGTPSSCSFTGTDYSTTRLREGDLMANSYTNSNGQLNFVYV